MDEQIEAILNYGGYNPIVRMRLDMWADFAVWNYGEWVSRGDHMAYLRYMFWVTRSTRHKLDMLRETDIKED